MLTLFSSSSIISPAVLLALVLAVPSVMAETDAANAGPGPGHDHGPPACVRECVRAILELSDEHTTSLTDHVTTMQCEQLRLCDTSSCDEHVRIEIEAFLGNGCRDPHGEHGSDPDGEGPPECVRECVLSVLSSISDGIPERVTAEQCAQLQLCDTSSCDEHDRIEIEAFLGNGCHGDHGDNGGHSGNNRGTDRGDRTVEINRMIRAFDAFVQAQRQIISRLQSEWDAARRGPPSNVDRLDASMDGDRTQSCRRDDDCPRSWVCDFSITDAFGVCAPARGTAPDVSSSQSSIVPSDLQDLGPDKSCCISSLSPRGRNCGCEAGICWALGSGGTPIIANGLGCQTRPRTTATAAAPGSADATANADPAIRTKSPHSNTGARPSGQSIPVNLRGAAAAMFDFKKKLDGMRECEGNSDCRGDWICVGIVCVPPAKDDPEGVTEAGNAAKTPTDLSAAVAGPAPKSSFVNGGPLWHPLSAPTVAPGAGPGRRTRRSVRGRNV